ncbi:MAG: lantibiotic dehydratase [Polyangiaceae bacterium]
MKDDLVELAPLLVARVAGFSIDSIAALASPDAATSGRAYEAAVERERQLLWTQTIGDRRFMSALALVNPAFAESVLDRPAPTGARNKRGRHLDTTLYRYLARAAARTEPCGAWCGVALAAFGDAPESSNTARPARFVVTPDLAPLRALVRALAARDVYRARGLYKLNPTLTKRAALAAYVYRTEPSAGSIERVLRATPATEAILEALRSRARWQLATATEAAANAARVSRITAARAIEGLRAGGVLVGGLAFPTTFESAWEAMDQLAGELVEEHRAAWSTARAELGAAAVRAEDALGSNDPRALLAAMADAHAAIGALYERCGVEARELPRACLRCDALAPWEIRLGAHDQARVRDALGEFVVEQARHGLGPTLGRAAERWWLRGLEDVALSEVIAPSLDLSEEGPCVTWQALARALDAGPELDARIAGAQASLMGSSTSEGPVSSEICTRQTPELTSDRAPLEALRFSFDALGALSIVGLGVDATGAFSRVADALRADGAASLERWFSGAHRAIERDTGVELVELAHDHDTPNVLARPALFSGVVDVWGTRSFATGRGREIAAEGIKLAVESRESGRSLLARDASGRAMSVLAPTAAVVDPRDEASHALLATSGRLPAALAYSTPPVFECELEAPTFTNRATLRGGATTRARRTLLHGGALAQLLEVTGAQRFARWQALAESLGWPELLVAQRDDGPPLLVARDSTLAVEALFEGAASTRVLRVEEPQIGAWLKGERCERYACELVLPLLWKQHRWSTAADSVAADEHLAAAR